MEIFQYDFMQKAFIVGLLLAVIIPCIGIVIVLRRLSMVGDALSHTSLAGVAIGLIFGFNPVLGAMAACVAASFSIEIIRKRFPQYTEISIAIMLSVGVGLAAILSGFVDNTASFNSFLFGSIVAISDFELWLVAGVAVIVLGLFILLYQELLSISFDEQLARLSGVPVRFVNGLFTVMTAITVSIAARTVGALIVSSLMVLPVACAMQVAKSYRQTVVWSVVFGVASTIIGLFVAFYGGLKPGGTIVLTNVVLLFVLFILKGTKQKINVN